MALDWHRCPTCGAEDFSVMIEYTVATATSRTELSLDEDGNLSGATRGEIELEEPEPNRFYCGACLADLPEAHQQELERVLSDA